MKRPHLRLFVAIYPPPSVRSLLARALEETRAIAPGAKVQQVEDLHLTLHFLGSTPVAERARIEAALLEVAAAAEPFAITLRGAGSFGPRSRPRVLYAATGEGAEAIAALAGRVRAALGAEDEGRFTPHVTLARARGQRGDPALARARRALEPLACPPFEARSIALVMSRPPGRASEGVARYQILTEAAFPA